MYKLNHNQQNKDIQEGLYILNVSILTKNSLFGEEEVVI